MCQCGRSSVSRAHRQCGGRGASRAGRQRRRGHSESEVRILDGAAVVGVGDARVVERRRRRRSTCRGGRSRPARGHLRIEVLPLDGERSHIDNDIDVGVQVAATRAPVLVFDARPSWSSTFVRRALEDDARFAVGYRARLAPALSAGTANGRLDAATLDVASGRGDRRSRRADVERRGAARAVRERARRHAGAACPNARRQGRGRGWFPARGPSICRRSRRRSGRCTRPRFCAPSGPPVTATVIARSGSSAAIVVVPSGSGRIVVSGAMDAWRYRRSRCSAALRRFWRSLVAEGAASGDGTAADVRARTRRARIARAIHASRSAHDADRSRLRRARSRDADPGRRRRFGCGPRARSASSPARCRCAPDGSCTRGDGQRSPCRSADRRRRRPGARRRTDAREARASA